MTTAMKFRETNHVHVWHAIWCSIEIFNLSLWNRVVYRSKHVAIHEHASSILEPNVYQELAVLVVNYFHRVILVEHLEIHAMYPNIAMACLLRYGTHHGLIQLIFCSSVLMMTIISMVRHAMRMVGRVFMASVLVHSSNVLISGDQVRFSI